MARNPWADAHASWYARATPAERATFDASRACPKVEVFTPAKFPSLAAWGLFLSHQGLEEAVVGTPLPMRLVVKGQVRVHDARRHRGQAIAGVGRCCQMGCTHEGTDVERSRCVAAHPENGSQDSVGYLCAKCRRWLVIDPMYGVASVHPEPLEG